MSPLIEDLNRLMSDVPALPVVGQRVMTMMGDDNTTNAQLGSVLSSDQALASRVLQMANSPYFGARSPISSVSNAVFVLGHSALRSLIITVCTKGLYKQIGLMEEKLWDYALASAIGAREIARATGFLDPDDAFVGGLLHDVGRTILAVNFHDPYRDIFAHCFNEDLPASELKALEKEEFGYDHNEIGQATIAKWKLPPVFGRMARRHHDTNPELLGREEQPQAVALVAQAGLIAERLGLGFARPHRDVDLLENPCNRHFLKLEAPALSKLVERTLLDFNENRKALRPGD